MLSKLMITRKLRFEQGKITAFSLPFSLVALSCIKAMTDDAMSKDIKAISDLYFYGWVYGYTVTKNIVNEFKLRKFQERYKVTMDIMGVLGFGDYQTTSFKKADHAKFKVLGNPFALQYYKSDKLFCHYIRGIEAGGGSWVHEILINNIEIECAAGNGQYCIHINLNPENMDKADKKLVEGQLDRKYIEKREKEFIESYGDDPSFFGID